MEKVKEWVHLSNYFHFVVNAGPNLICAFKISKNILNIHAMILQMLLKDDDFYKIRVPSNVVSPPGRDYIISSVKAVSLPLTKFLFEGSI